MENQQYSDLLLNQTKDLIWMVDQHFALVYANSAYLKLMKEVTGVEIELNTSVLVDGFGEGYMEKWKAYYQRALSGEDFTIEEHFFHPGNNQTQYGHISFSPITDEDGKVNCVACRNTDVTNIVREKYRASSLMDASLDVFCTIDEAGNFVYVSDSSTEHWGYTPDELINTPYLELVLKEDIAKTKTVADAVIAGEETTSFTNRYKRKDGAIAYNLWSARWDDEAKLMYCVARDAKEKIEEEQRLKLLSSVITNTNDAVLITEAEPVHEPGPRIVYVNEAFTRMTGYTAEDVIGKTPRILQGPKSNTEELAKLGEALRNWQPYEITTINYKKNGEEFWINFTVTPVADETGWYTHWIAIERDVTAQKNAELEKNLLAQIAACFQEKDLNQAGNALCKIIRDFADFELVELWSPNLQRTEFSRIAYDTNLQAFLLENNAVSNLPITEGLQGKVWEQKKQFLWNEAEIAENFARKVEAQDEGIKHILGVPIIHHEEINDVLVIGTKKDAKQLSKLNDIIQNLETFIGSEINRKRLERDLIRLYDSIPNLVSVGDFHGKFLRINKAGCDLLGYEEDEILNQGFEKFIHPDDLDDAYKELARLQTEDGALEIELRFLTKSGESIWLSWFCNVKVNEGLIYCTAKNITEEKKLRELNRQVGKLAKIGGWELNLTTMTPFFSEEVFKIYEIPFGTPPKLEDGISFYAPEARPIIQDAVYQAIENNVPYELELPFITAKGKSIWVKTHGKAEFIDGKAVKLVGAIQDTTDRKLAEIALSESETKFKTIFEIVTLGIAQVDPSNGKINLVNSHYETITGYTVDELLEISFVELTHPDDRATDWELFSKAAKGEGEYRNEKRYVKKDGTIVWVRLHVAFIRDETGKPTKTVAICEDITDRKEAESRLQGLSDNIPGVVFQYNIHPDGNEEFKYVSKGAKNIFGISPKDVIENIDLVWDQIKAGGDYDAVRQSIVDSIGNKSKWSQRFRIVKPDGEKRIIQGLGTPEFLSNGTVQFNSVVLDITYESRTQELLDDVEKLNKIGSWEVNLIQNTIYWSDQVHRIYETNPITFQPAAEKAINFYREDYRELVSSAYEDCIKNGKAYDIEAVVITATGKERWVHTTFRAEIVNGVSTRVYGSFQDITEEKNAEIEFRTITERLQVATEAASIGIWDWDIPQNNLIWDEKMYAIYNVDPTDFNGAYEAWEATVHPDDKERASKDVENAINGVSEFDSIFRIIWKDKSVHYIKANALIERDENGQALRMVGTNLDITREKTAERQVVLALQEKNNILESIGDAFFAVDKNWTITYWNKRAESVMGRKREDIIGQNLWDVYPDATDLEFYHQYHAAVKTGEKVNFEEYYPALNLWLDVSAYPSKEGLSVYFKNVTQRKKSEEERNNLQKTLENSLNEIYIFDSEMLQFSYINKGALHNLGYSAKEIKELTPLDLKPEYTLSSFRELITPLLLKEKERIVFFTKHQRKDGSRYPVEVHLQLIEEGNSKNFVAIILDITERKENEELLKLTTELAKIGSWEVDLRKNTIYWSDMVHQLHGTDPNSFVPDLETAIDFYHEDYREMVNQHIAHAVKTGESWDFEAVLVDTNKQEVWVRAIGEPEFIDGECVRLFGSFQDITEIKTLELRLKALSDDLPGVSFQYRVSPEGEDSRHLTSKASYKIWGVSPEESERNVDIVWDQIKKGGDFEEVQKSIEKSMKSGEKWHFQWRNLLPSGELRWHEGFGTPNYLPDGTIVFNSMIFDFTERKQSEQELLKSNQKLRNIAWTQSHEVRAPLSRILGIINLIEAEKGSSDDLMFLLNQLKASSNEMDNIVKKVTEEAQEIKFELKND